MSLNTRKDKETNDFSTVDTHIFPGTQMGALNTHEFSMGHMSRESRRLAPDSSLTCAWHLLLAAQGAVL